ncbi:MAG: hypothetical protein ACI8RD_013119, partial [Bacillariaceae sp.]
RRKVDITDTFHLVKFCIYIFLNFYFIIIIKEEQQKRSASI